MSAQPTRPDLRGRCVWLAAPFGAVLLLAMLGCGKRTRVETRPDATPPQAPAQERASEGKAQPDAPSDHPPAAPIPEQAWSEDRWLEVTGHLPDKPGAWATGSFDEKHNKLVIDTHDARRFIVKIDMIPIDWDRRVILSLNETNTELRPRESTVLTFELDEHNRWVILEPPARRPE